MKDIHIATIGELFHNEDGFDFLSDQNMLEYDFILIESDVFINSLMNGYTHDIDKRIKHLKEFVKVKNVPVVFLCYRGGSFYPKYGDAKSITGLMEVDSIEEQLVGKKIEVNNDSLFADIILRYKDSFEYKVTFSEHPGVSIGKAKAKSNSIGFYTSDCVFLPALKEDNDIDYNSFLHEIYEVCCLIRRSDNIPTLPEWTNNYLLPGEYAEKQRLNKIQLEIKKLEKQRIESELRLTNFLPLKQLWSASGAVLEQAVKKVFIELGFKMLPSVENRDDIIMEFNEQIFIAEVKGQNKSAAEKNAAQLEKWVSTYISNNEGSNPKGLLIVNTFREQILEDRTQVSFPNQMLTYSIVRNHCLLTTLQLCCLLLFCRDNPNEKENIIDNLLSTSGCFERFNNWSELIGVEDKQKKNATSQNQV